MLSGTFYRKLKNLNPKLRIYCTDRKDTPAGLYIIDTSGEYVELCGVDKNYINEWPTYDRYGKMLKGGWRRVLVLLVSKRLIDRRKSYRHFGHWDEHREPPIVVEQSPIDNAIMALTARPVGYKTIENPLQEGSTITVPVFDTDDVVDVGRMVKKENDQRQAPAAFTESGALFKE